MFQAEAAALEAANVFAMLQSTPQVDGVIADLRRTQSILDDLDESLKVNEGAGCANVVGFISGNPKKHA